MSAKVFNTAQRAFFDLIHARMGQRGGNFGKVPQQVSAPVAAPDSSMPASVKAPLFGAVPLSLERRSIRDIPLEELAKLPPDEKLLLAEQLFFEAKREYGIFMQFGMAFHLGSKSTAARLHFMRWQEDRFRWFDDVEEAILKDLSQSHELLFRNYMSSYRQITQTGGSKLQHTLGRETVAALRELQEDTHNDVMVDSDKGYRVGMERSEMAFAVAIGFRENAVDYTWQDTRLVMTLPANGLKNSERFEMLDVIAWPPQPDDPVLQAYQRILGWKFDIETSTDHITFTIDFGKSYTERDQ